MSMITRRTQNNSGNDPKLPRAPAMPAPPAVSPIYDEEAIRRYQKDVDRERLVLQLEQERDEWKRKCLAAEEDNRRLEMRLDRDVVAHDAEVGKLTEQRDRKINELTQQRDDYKVKLARLETKLVMNGEALIKLASATSETTSKLLEEIRAEQGKPDDAGNVASLAAVADAIALDEDATK